MSQNFYFYSDFVAVGLYEIEYCLVEWYEEDSEAVVLIFIFPNICENRFFWTEKVNAPWNGIPVKELL